MVACSAYWGYFQPILEWMPKNCSTDVQAVIAHIDSVFTSDNKKEIDSIKALFNMSALTHLDDAAGARTYSCSCCVTYYAGGALTFCVKCVTIFGIGSRFLRRPAVDCSLNSATLWKSRTASARVPMGGGSNTLFRPGARTGRTHTTAYVSIVQHVVADLLTN